MNYMDTIQRLIDTRIAFHAKHADISDPGEIVTRANDTDIAIIFLANISLFSSEV